MLSGVQLSNVLVHTAARKRLIISPWLVRMSQPRAFSQVCKEICNCAFKISMAPSDSQRSRIACQRLLHLRLDVDTQAGLEVAAQGDGKRDRKW